VILRSTSPDFKWNVSGKTDEKGVAAINTDGFYPGVPEGTYKVVVTKIVEKETSFVSPVEKQYDSETTTPLEIEITAKNNDKTFELGQPVEVFISKKRKDDAPGMK